MTKEQQTVRKRANELIEQLLAEHGNDCQRNKVRGVPELNCRKRTQRAQREGRQSIVPGNNLTAFFIQDWPGPLCVPCVLSRPTSVFGIKSKTFLNSVIPLPLIPLPTASRPPEAVRELPGFGEVMRAESMKITKNAILSRTLAVVVERALVICLPGKPSGAVECLSFVGGAIPHCVEVLQEVPTNC